MQKDEMRIPDTKAAIEKGRQAKPHIEKTQTTENKQKNEAMKSEQKNCCE